VAADAEIRALRAALADMAGETDPELVRRYVLKFPSTEHLSLYRRMRIRLGAILRDLGLRPRRQLEPWLATLEHMPVHEDARPVIIWALDMERDAVREACRKFASLLSGLPELVPVLITDTADFSFYSRLGWLVEYLPDFDALANQYAERKRHYLAWRYKDAASVPASIGLQDDLTLGDLQLDPD